MIRIILTMILPLVAPTMIYFLLVWLRAKWKKEDERAENVPAYHTWPWFRLIGFGGVLFIITFVIFGFPGYDQERGEYVPPHMENGELVPGQFIKENDQ